MMYYKFRVASTNRENQCGKNNFFPKFALKSSPLENNAVRGHPRSGILIYFLLESILY
jgi:hypothetical protein